MGVQVEMRLKLYRVPREDGLDKFESVQITNDIPKVKAVLKSAIAWLDDLESYRCPECSYESDNYRGLANHYAGRHVQEEARP